MLKARHRSRIVNILWCLPDDLYTVCSSSINVAHTYRICFVAMIMIFFLYFSDIDATTFFTTVITVLRRQWPVTASAVPLAVYYERTQAVATDVARIALKATLTLHNPRWTSLM
eukprot:239261-Pleurochrysis_carterae.AAC.3